MNRSWKALWVKYIHIFKSFVMPSLEITQIIDLSRSVVFENLEVDVAQLLQSHEEELNPEELAELTLEEEEEAVEEKEVIASKEEPTVKWLATYLKNVYKLIQEGTDIDPCMEHSLQTGRKIESNVATYRELYQEKHNTAKKFTLKQFFKQQTSTSSNVITNSPSDSNMMLSLPPSPHAIL